MVDAAERRGRRVRLGLICAVATAAFVAWLVLGTHQQSLENKALARVRVALPGVSLDRLNQDNQRMLTSVGNQQAIDAFYADLPSAPGAHIDGIATVNAETATFRYRMNSDRSECILVTISLQARMALAAPCPNS